MEEHTLKYKLKKCSTDEELRQDGLCEVRTGLTAYNDVNKTREKEKLKEEEEVRYELNYPRQLSPLEIIMVGIRVMLLLQLM